MNKLWIIGLMLWSGTAVAQEKVASLVQPMNVAQCRQVLRDAADLYYDNQHCIGNDDSQAEQKEMTAFFLMGTVKEKIFYETFGHCPDMQRMTNEEAKAFFAVYPRHDKPQEVAQYCATNRKRMTDLYRHYQPLVEELDRELR